MALNTTFKQTKDQISGEGEIRCPKCDGQQGYRWYRIDLKGKAKSQIKEVCFDPACNYIYEGDGTTQSPNTSRKGERRGNK